MRLEMRILRLLLPLLLLQAFQSTASAPGRKIISGVISPAETNTNAIITRNSLLCRITTLHTYGEDQLGAENNQGHQEDTVCIPVLDEDTDHESEHLLPIKLPQDIQDDHVLAIAQGTLLVSIEGASVIQNHVLSLEPDANITAVPHHTAPPHVRRRLATTDDLSVIAANARGRKTAMIVRVSGSDASPPTALKKMEEILFDTSKPNFATQYQACSFGRLTWTKVSGYDIRLPNPIASYENGGNAVGAATDQILERSGVSALSELADYILFCVAPGTGRWHAVAPVNHWRSQYNGEWCTSMGATMHELGHNIGLLHSGEGESSYGDSTGVMGAGGTQPHAPLKCFNGVKNFQLGWYRNRVVELSRLSQGRAQRFTLASFVDYPYTSGTEPVIIVIDRLYYLQYNQAKLFNKETGEKENLVTVTEDIVGERSYNVAGLDVGNEFTVPNYAGSRSSLIIHVCDKKWGRPDAMVVSVGLGSVDCDDSFNSMGGFSDPSSFSRARCGDDCDRVDKVYGSPQRQRGDYRRRRRTQYKQRKLARQGRRVEGASATMPTTKNLRMQKRR